MIVVLYITVFFSTMIFSIMFQGIIPGGMAVAGDNSLLICLSLINASIITSNYMIIRELKKSNRKE